MTSPISRAAGGVDGLAEQGQLHRLAGADQARQEEGATAVGHQADVHEGEHQAGGRGRVAQVAGQRETQADTSRHAVDGGEHRLLELVAGAG